MLSRPLRARVPAQNIWGRESMLSQSSTCELHQRIHVQSDILPPGIEAGTGPGPVRRLTDQPSTHRVVVDVVDHGTQGGRFVHVAVVAAAALPETVMHFPVGLFVAHTGQE